MYEHTPAADLLLDLSLPGLGTITDALVAIAELGAELAHRRDDAGAAAVTADALRAIGDVHQLSERLSDFVAAEQQRRCAA